MYNGFLSDAPGSSSRDELAVKPGGSWAVSSASEGAVGGGCGGYGVMPLASGGCGGCGVMPLASGGGGCGVMLVVGVGNVCSPTDGGPVVEALAAWMTCVRW